GHSIRDLFHKQDNVQIHTGTVVSVDLDARKAQFADLAEQSYDYLVLGLGAEVNYFGTDGAADNAFPMYTLPDAVRLKNQLLERWEAVDRNQDRADDGALNVVVVGGGPTGVETAGALAELYRSDFAKDYRELPHDEARIVLVEAGPKPFAMFKEDPQESTTEALGKRTVGIVSGDPP